jgi:hypothetical protein
MEFLIVITAFCIGFPLLWSGTVFLISRLGGWATLAGHYAYSGTSKAPQRKNTSMALIRLKLIPCNYGFIIHLHVDNDALYISVMKVFRIGHPTLRIPFRDISISHRKAGFLAMGQLNLSKASNISISMLTKDIDWIESVYGNLQPRP